MKVLKAFCALLLLVPATAEARTSAPAILEALPEVDRVFGRAAGESPGLVYGVVADGRLVHLRTLGVQDLEVRRPVTPDSVFRIASMTKLFTALAILKLRDEGKVALDAPAETYVPEMRGWRYPTSDSPRITVRHLLTHSAGFVTDNPWGDRQQPLPEASFTAMLRAGVPLSSPPGTRMEYSNLGYALLGRIVANASGRSYRYYVEQALLKPLGMGSTGFEVSDAPIEQRARGYRRERGGWRAEPDMAHGAFGAMGGLQTSAKDYARFVAWLLSAWPARDGPEAGPLRRASIREIAEGANFLRSGSRPGGGEMLAEAYGLGVNVAADPALGLTLGHSGGYPGYGSYMLLLPEQGVGIFAFANATYAGPVPQVWQAAMAFHQYGALRTPRPSVSPLLAEAYAAVGNIYGRGDVLAARDRLAMNFLMDRPADQWREDLDQLKLMLGGCDTRAPISPTGALSGSFVWSCARGKARGELLLAPTARAGIQKLSIGPEFNMRLILLSAGSSALLILFLAFAARKRFVRRRQAMRAEPVGQAA